MYSILSEARGLGRLPALNGSTRLRTLRADRARLARLPRDLCDHAPQLRALLVLHSGRYTNITLYLFRHTLHWRSMSLNDKPAYFDAGIDNELFLLVHYVT